MEALYEDVLLHILDFQHYHEFKALSSTNLFIQRKTSQYLLNPNILLDEHSLPLSSDNFKQIIPYIKRLYFKIPSAIVSLMLARIIPLFENNNLKSLIDLEFPDAMYVLMKPLWIMYPHTVHTLKLGDDYRVNSYRDAIQSCPNITSLKLRVLDMLDVPYNEDNVINLKVLAIDNIINNENHLFELQPLLSNLRSLVIYKSKINLLQYFNHYPIMLKHLSYHGNYEWQASDIQAINTYCIHLSTIEFFTASKDAWKCLRNNHYIKRLGLFGRSPDKVFKYLSAIPNLQRVILSSLTLTGTSGLTKIHNLHSLYHNNQVHFKQIEIRDRLKEDRIIIVGLLELMFPAIEILRKNKEEETTK
jgi:hypothetical protein